MGGEEGEREQDEGKEGGTRQGEKGGQGGGVETGGEGRRRKGQATLSVTVVATLSVTVVSQYGTVVKACQQCVYGDYVCGGKGERETGGERGAAYVCVRAGRGTQVGDS